MDLSVIIVTFNRPQRCFDVVKHTAKALAGRRAEILVVNNGTQPVDLPEYMEEIPCRILTAPRNLGAAAKNIAMAVASGIYLLVLDDDAYIESDVIEPMICLFQGDPTLGAVSFRIAGNTAEEACILPSVFHGCACAFRRDILQAIGGYPADFVYYGEEYDVAFRLYAAGYKTGLCDKYFGARHVREQSGRNISRIIHYLVRNNLYLWFAYFPLYAIPGAVGDTLRYYRLVAQKEGAEKGFWQGCLSLFGSAARGLHKRKVLPPVIFGLASLNSAVENACLQLKNKGVQQVIICGVGKIPSVWKKTIERHLIRIQEYWDFNPCWKNQSLLGKPVVYIENNAQIREKLNKNTAYLVGMSALSETRNWSNLLQINKLIDKSIFITPPVCSCDVTAQ